MVKKLAGAALGTASWATNVGNEFGQALISVLTTHEGTGLKAMTNGLMRRYSSAEEHPPSQLYVDRDCCSTSGPSPSQRLFAQWESLVVRLDIWHFMKRIATGCTTDCHPLYGVFLSRLSSCIFEWDPADVQLLQTAKQEELLHKQQLVVGDGDIDYHITKSEMSLHCRRRTRGV